MAQQLSNQRIAWFNGKFVPESDVVIPFRDRSWKYGDGAFDMTRTFEGKPFRLKEHIDRFYRSLRYLQIDPGLSPKEMIAHSEEVVARNEHLRAQVGDWWLGQRVSRGVDAVGDEGWDHTGPNVVIEMTPLPFAKRAKQYRDGGEVMTTTARRIAPSMLSPRAKTHNYLNLIMADREVRARDPKAWAVLLDVNGNLCEGLGSNIFVIRDGKVFTPPTSDNILEGLTRLGMIELLRKELDMEVLEQSIDRSELYIADEIFLCGTGAQISPVIEIDHRPIGEGQVGPVVARIQKLYFDIVRGRNNKYRHWLTPVY